MLKPVVIDADGEWVVNPCQFPFPDTSGRVFAPGVKYKVKLDGWVEVQLAANALSRTDPPPRPASPAKAPTAPAAPSPAVGAVVKAQPSV